MLTDDRLNTILDKLPQLRIAVLGDLFLDRYLDLDGSLTEASIETGLDAYQVTSVRPSPGAAGTVVNNLAALGVGCVAVLSVIGDDGEGYELRQALRELRAVDARWVFNGEARRTPTYTKPILHEPAHPGRELNRFDIKNRKPLGRTEETAVLEALDEVWRQVDALVVLDQVSETDCGVITQRVRDRLTAIGESDPEKLILADSRSRIGLFRSVWAKPNQSECVRAVDGKMEDVERCALELSQRTGRPVFCTGGEQGVLLADARRKQLQAVRIPAYPVHGPVDIVGAGDSASAAIACAVAAGASPTEAAAFGNLLASITIQQLGTTGTATPEQVRQRWSEVSA